VPLLVASSLAAGPESYNLLTELQFPQAADLPGWEPRPGDRGKVFVADETLCIETLAGEGQEWAGNHIQYQYGFILEKATVRIEVDVASQNSWRDFFMALLPQGGSLHREPGVWLNISNGNTSGVLVRRIEQGQATAVADAQQLPFKLNGGALVVLTLRNGSMVLEVSRGDEHRQFSFPDLVPPGWRYRPFTVYVGTCQHGNPGEAARVRISSIRILSSRSEELSAQELASNRPGRDDSVTYIYLEEAANRRFEGEVVNDGDNGWTDQGPNDLRYIPRGYQFFRNVPFYISDRVEVVGNAYLPACVILRSHHNEDLPLASDPITVKTKACYLYFLHTAAWAAAGSHLADYLVTYADGATVTIPLRVGQQVGEWWDPEDLPEAVVAWQGRNKVKYPVGFTYTEIGAKATLYYRRRGLMSRGGYGKMIGNG